jgi:hypothetical protein
VYVSCGLSVKLVEIGVAGLVPAEPYMVSLTEAVVAKPTLPLILSLTEVIGGVPTLLPILSLTEVIGGEPGVPFIVSVNMNVPGESSISLGCNGLLTTSVIGPSITYVSDGANLATIRGLPVTLYV